jgi:X-Pro dipeptidyl-peptidase-like protein
MGGIVRAAAAGAVAAALGVLAAPGSAHADLASLEASCALRDAADGDTANGPDRLPFFHCDDGTPDHGGTDPNPAGDKAVEVPAAYQGFAGLPARDDAAAVAAPGADGEGNIALDANISLPDPRVHSPAGGYPLIVFMHGCCGGDKTSWQADTVEGAGAAEKWHHSNAWFASRGYAVLTYTARGFVNGQNKGSTGQTQLDHRAFEINDYQQLAGLLADDSFNVGGQAVTIDAARVVTIGGSYGGGFSWLALTDPVWRSPAGKEMRLAATAPKYGWTDLAYALVPNGAHLEDRQEPTDGAATSDPIGFPKRSIVAGLFVTGNLPAGSPHTTFPPEIGEAFACLQSPLPFDSNPQCAAVRQQTLPSFIDDRSAYYQNDFFRGIADGSVPRVPVFAAGTLTDPLFPGREHRRMAARLRSAAPGYPIKEVYGDYQHFVQNKRKEWSDLCGGDRHVCTLDDAASSVVRSGINSALSDFVDHYARPPANPAQVAPSLDVSASLQICPLNASEQLPLDEPGPRFTASTFEALAPNVLLIDLEGQQTTTSKAAPNAHALAADPVANQVGNSSRCPSGAGSAGPGVAVYDSEPLDRTYTMIGATRVTAPYQASGSELQLNARLYDVPPSGDPAMVDRGFRTLGNAPSGEAVLDLMGNGWRFERGHRIRVELAQDDDPFLKASTVPSRMTLEGVTLRLPVREETAPEALPVAGGGGGGGGGGGEPAEDGGDEADAAPAGTGQLPFTGLALAPVLALGFLLVALGATLHTAVRSSRWPQGPFSGRRYRP